MNPKPLINRIVTHFRDAYPELEEARTITMASGLSMDKFPDNVSNQYQRWPLILEAIIESNRLEALLQHAAQDPTIGNSKQGFEALLSQINIIDKLSSFLTLSKLSLSEFQRQYYQVLPKELTPIKVDSEEEIILNLLEYRDGPKLLLQFMWRVSELVEDDLLTQHIKEWCQVDALNSPYLKLNPNELTDIKSTEKNALPSSNALIIGVAIEPSKEGEDQYILKFYTAKGDQPFQLCASQEEQAKVSKSKLEERIAEEIFLLEIENEDFLSQEEDNPIQETIIVFFLPQSLLELDMDSWRIENQKFIERFPVVTSSLNRYKALSERKKLSDKSLDKKAKAVLLRKLRSNPDLKDYLSTIKEWLVLWQKFKQDIGKPLQENLLEIELEKIIDTYDPDQLRIELKERATFNNQHCAAFTFPTSFSPYKLDELFFQLMVIGIPIIICSRENKEKEDLLDLQPVRNSLQVNLIQKYCDDPINSVNDLIRIIHGVRMNALANPADEFHLGRSLTFILDDPDREIQMQKRNTHI